MVFNLGSTKPIFLFWRLQYPIKGCFFWRYCPHFHFSLQYILNKKKDIVGIICCLFIRIYRIKTIFGNYNKIPLFENILFLKHFGFEQFFWGFNWISLVSTLCDDRLVSVLRDICNAWRIPIVQFMCHVILFHSSSCAVTSCKRFCGWGQRILTLLPN